MRKRTTEFLVRAQALGAAVAVVLAHASARAVEPVGLTYFQSEAASVCPGEAELRRLVVARLGYDPFRADAALSVSVGVDRAESGFLARIELTRGSQRMGERELGNRADCAELIALVALSLSIAIDPDKAAPAPALDSDAPASHDAPQPPAPPGDDTARSSRAAAPAEPAQLESPSEAPPHASSRAPWRLGASMAMELSFGLLPRTAVGGQASIRFWREAFSLDLGAQATLPTELSLSDGGFVRSHAFGATLSPCWLQGPWQLCGLLSAVKISAASEDTIVSRGGAAWYGAVGVRAGFEWPERTRMALLVRASALMHWQEVTLMLDQEPVWTAPWASATLGVGAVARF